MGAIRARPGRSPACSPEETSATLESENRPYGQENRSYSTAYEARERDGLTSTGSILEVVFKLKFPRGFNS
jgi:hypothetical protein